MKLFSIVFAVVLSVLPAQALTINFEGSGWRYGGSGTIDLLFDTSDIWAFGGDHGLSRFDLLLDDGTTVGGALDYGNFRGNGFNLYLFLPHVAAGSSGWISPYLECGQGFNLDVAAQRTTMATTHQSIHPRVDALITQSLSIDWSWDGRAGTGSGAWAFENANFAQAQKTASVPDSTATASLLLFALLGLVAARRHSTVAQSWA